MTGIGPVPKGPSGHPPQVSAAHRVLGRAYSSVKGLFDAVTELDLARRATNSSAKRRMSRVEIDILRSAIVLKSAGLDAAMTRLVKDIGTVLASTPGCGARRQVEEYLKHEPSRPNITEPFRVAVLALDIEAALLANYLADRTRRSF